MSHPFTVRTGKLSSNVDSCQTILHLHQRTLFAAIIKNLLLIFLPAVLFFSTSFSQVVLPPSDIDCPSGDLEVTSAILPAPPNDPCSCTGTRILQLGIINKTGSDRTSFAMWGKLIRKDASGNPVGSPEAIFACATGIKASSTNFYPTTTAITVACDQSLEIVDVILAWTSANKKETCEVLKNSPATINPKCGRVESIRVEIGVDAAFNVTSATCSNGTSSIVTNPFGGKPPYSYSWSASEGGIVPSGQATNKDLTGLTPGKYTIVITDANGCTGTRDRRITNPSALALGTCSKTDVTCFGGSNGSVTAGDVSNSIGTVHYSWKSASDVVVGTTATVNDLPAGSYSLTVSDDCSSKTCSVIIGGPSAALALGTCSKTDVTCFGGSNGSVTAGDVSNSIGTVHYSWKSASDVVVGTTATVNDLPAGSYSLTVSDDCSSKTCSVIIGGPSAALALGTCSKTDVTCFGGSNGSVTAGTVSNNVGTIHYSWENGSDVEVGTSATVNNLPAGSYTLTVTDDCSSKTCSVTIGAPSAGLSLGTCSKTNATCTTGGSVSAGTVSNNVGTIHYSWKNAANEEVGTSATVNGLPAGSYILTVTDDCSSTTCTVSIDGATGIDAPSVCVVQPSLCGPATGTVTVTAPLGDDYEYSINDGTSFQKSNVFNNVAAGSVTGIKVKIGDCISPAANCAASNCSPQTAGRTQTTSSTQNKSGTSLNTLTDLKVSEPTVKAFPNPFGNKVKFIVNIPEAGNGSLELVNLLGQKVKTVFQGRMPAGANTFEVNLPLMRSSQLIYMLRMGDKQVTGKLVQLNQ